MDSNCKVAFTKAKELIKRNKEKYGVEVMPEVQPFDDGNIFFQYFIKWDDFWDKTKLKTIEILGVDDYMKNVKFVFSEEGNDVDITIFDFDKTYIVVNGEIDFKLEDGTIQKVSSNETYKIPKEIAHGGLTVRDTYVIVIES